MPIARSRFYQQIRASQAQQFESQRDIVDGYLVEVNGSVTGSREDLVWVKALDPNSPPFEVYNPGILQDLRKGIVVNIERNPKAPSSWQIIQIDKDKYFPDAATYDTLPKTQNAPHANLHEHPPGRPGADVMRIYPRQLMDFAVRPTTSKRSLATDPSAPCPMSAMLSPTPACRT